LGGEDAGEVLVSTYKQAEEGLGLDVREALTVSAGDAEPDPLLPPWIEPPAYVTGKGI
jgi:hypothetical protein